MLLIQLTFSDLEAFLLVAMLEPSGRSPCPEMSSISLLEQLIVRFFRAPGTPVEGSGTTPGPVPVPRGMGGKCCLIVASRDL